MKIGVYSNYPPFLSVLNLFPIYHHLDHPTEFCIGRVIWVAPHPRTCFHTYTCMRLSSGLRSEWIISSADCNCSEKNGRTISQVHTVSEARMGLSLCCTPIVKLCFLPPKNRAKDLFMSDASWSIPNFFMHVSRHTRLITRRCCQAHATKARGRSLHQNKLQARCRRSIAPARLKFQSLVQIDRIESPR